MRTTENWKTRLLSVGAAACLCLLPGCSPTDVVERVSEEAMQSSQTSTDTVEEPEVSVDSSSYQRGREPVPFSQLTYVRPDLDAMQEVIAQCVRRIGESDSAEAALGCMNEARIVFNNYETMFVLADIHHDIDRSDATWETEWQFCDEGYVVFDELWEDVAAALEGSAWSEELLPLWEIYDDSLRKSSRDCTQSEALEQELEEIADEAVDIIQNATVQYKGEATTFPEANRSKSASVAWLEEYGEPLLELYTRMVVVGDALARDCYGYESYADYLFDSYGRDYTPTMALQFIDNVESELLPLDDAITEMGYHDYGEKPFGDFNTCLRLAESVLPELHPDMGGALLVMRENELYYTRTGKNTHPRGFVSHLMTPNVPFLFCPYAGDLAGLGDFTHEFGHYYEMYSMMDNSCMTYDLSEMHSQALTLLFAQQAQKAMGDQDFLRYTVADTVRTVRSQSFNASIELRAFAFAASEATPEAIAQIGIAQSGAYSKGQQHELFAKYRWLTDSSLFTDPLQKLSYATSASTALDVWWVSRSDMAEAVEAYQQLVHRNGTRQFDSNIQAAGLTSPFVDGSFTALARNLRAWAQEKPDK